MKRIRITLKGSRFFNSVVREARRRDIEIYVCNKKKGIITCGLDHDFVDWLTEHGVIVSEIPDPKNMSWRVYPAEFRLTSASFVHNGNGHDMERLLGLPRNSLGDGCELTLEQKELIESHGNELEMILPPQN